MLEHDVVDLRKHVTSGSHSSLPDTSVGFSSIEDDEDYWVEEVIRGNCEGEVPSIDKPLGHSAITLPKVRISKKDTRRQIDNDGPHIGVSFSLSRRINTDCPEFAHIGHYQYALARANNAVIAASDEVHTLGETPIVTKPEKLEIEYISPRFATEIIMNAFNRKSHNKPVSPQTVANRLRGLEKKHERAEERYYENEIALLCSDINGLAARSTRSTIGDPEIDHRLTVEQGGTADRGGNIAALLSGIFKIESLPPTGIEDKTSFSAAFEKHTEQFLVQDRKRTVSYILRSLGVWVDDDLWNLMTRPTPQVKLMAQPVSSPRATKLRPAGKMSLPECLVFEPYSKLRTIKNKCNDNASHKT